jgi:hypothetical protein
VLFDQINLRIQALLPRRLPHTQGQLPSSLPSLGCSRSGKNRRGPGSSILWLTHIVDCPSLSLKYRLPLRGRCFKRLSLFHPFLSKSIPELHAPSGPQREVPFRPDSVMAVSNGVPGQFFRSTVHNLPLLFPLQDPNQLYTHRLITSCELDN